MQRKAVIVGGSNGIGMAIGKLLIEKGYTIIVVDREDPAKEVYCKADTYEFYKSDLRYFDDELFERLANDEQVNVLVITAGIGRVSNFEQLHISEIEKTVKINLESTLKVISIFYNKICLRDKFYTGVMVSIAGLLSSPMFSVYAASKAAVARFIESVNIELEVKKTSNRILNISPGAIQGSKFNGGENVLSKMENLAEGIIENLFQGKDLYIPDYENVYRDVLERYNKNPQEFGLQSYKYKQESGRNNHSRKVQIGYLSGTFDLFHVGHLNLLMKAKEQCDYLIVGVHSDGKWKNKETFISLEERKKIVAACRYVDKVVDSCQEDSDAWELWHYTKLFVGSDYKGTERFERYEKILGEKGVEIVYFPYTQGISSTEIREMIKG